MKLIDKIVLNRTIKIILGFILAVIKIFERKESNIPDSPLVPKPKKRPIKDLLDSVVPWRKK